MIFEKTLSTIKKYNLIEKGDKIVLGLSGGPDSVCLLHLLNRMKDVLDIEVYAAHLNHQIRGMEAQKDALYVSDLCERLGITFFVKSIDVPKYCKENKLSIEEGARKLRYEMFFEIKESLNADKIAIAHNMNDQAETVLMRMMRGTGLQGLKGIDYMRDGVIIRPILDIERADIEAYCEEHKLTPRIDATNLETIYTRNKIRLELIPYMKENFNSNVTESIVRMSNSLKSDNDFIEEEAIKAFDKVSSKNEDELEIKLNNYINETSINLRKVLIDGEFKVQNNKIIFTITDKENTEKIILNDSVFKAKNKPTLESDIKEKLNKLGNDIYVFDNLKIDIPSDIFIPMTTINNLRRDIIKKLTDDRIRVKNNYQKNNVILNKSGIKITNDIFFEERYKIIDSKIIYVSLKTISHNIM